MLGTQKEGVWGYSYMNPGDIQIETYSELIFMGYKFSSRIISTFILVKGCTVSKYLHYEVLSNFKQSQQKVE